MRFFKRLFGIKKKDPFISKRKKGNDATRHFELRLLNKCKRNRDKYIQRMCEWDLNEIDKTIA